MNEIEVSVRAFLKLLNAGWTDVSSLQVGTNQPSLLDDWAQASWEAIVEGTIPFSGQPVRLVVYGNGADLHGGSSRFSFPGDNATHQVRCQPVGDNVVDCLSGRLLPYLGYGQGYALDRFVSMSGAWYKEGPPFDHALLERQDCEYVIALDQLDWLLIEVTSD